MTPALRALAALALASLALACGGDDAAISTTPDAVDLAAEQAAATPASERRGDAADEHGDPSMIRGVDLQYEELVPGAIVQAKVRTAELADPEYAYVWKLDRRILSGNSPTIVLPDDARKGQVLELSVVVAEGERRSRREFAHARIGNRPPRWISLAIEPTARVVPGTELRVTPVADDPDEDALLFEYYWIVNGQMQGRGEPTFATDGLSRGDEVLAEVVLSDGSEEIAQRSAVVEIANRDPKIVSQPARMDSLRFVYQVEVEDPDGDRRFRYRLGAHPPDMEIDLLGGELVWDASHAKPGKHSVEIVVSDMNGGEARQQFDLTLRELAPDGTPIAADASATPAPDAA
ncbi:MAG: hypothetical protein KC560_17315, partial [Myxococcales bacterium]|nr:hypothetical protein [Myxococcales bacterium]